MLFLVVCVHLLDAKDLVLGSRVNNLLISTEKVVYNKIPLIRRDKDYTYTDPKNRIIKVEYINDKLFAFDLRVVPTELSRKFHTLKSRVWR